MIHWLEFATVRSVGHCLRPTDSHTRCTSQKEFTLSFTKRMSGNSSLAKRSQYHSRIRAHLSGFPRKELRCSLCSVALLLCLHSRYNLITMGCGQGLLHRRRLRKISPNKSARNCQRSSAVFWYKSWDLTALNLPWINSLGKLSITRQYNLHHSF